MSKKIVAVLGGLALLMTTASVVLATDNGPAEIKLDFNGKSKAVAGFKHHEHQKRNGDCKVCHHKAKEGEPMKACKTCHQEKKGEAPAIKDAYHDKCKGCHQKEKKGPTKCEDCHGK
ncbi:MAG: cytochrome c3 family protein [Candidatus Schekmanbacteria bacterium]|nr:cytochrome c3 family protein [Candidatus Schekmanbacteria bacterium]